VNVQANVVAPVDPFPFRDTGDPTMASERSGPALATSDCAKAEGTGQRRSDRPTKRVRTNRMAMPPPDTSRLAYENATELDADLGNNGGTYLSRGNCDELPHPARKSRSMSTRKS
jgi:hypothetical protein